MSILKLLEMHYFNCPRDDVPGFQILIIKAEKKTMFFNSFQLLKKNTYLRIASIPSNRTCSLILLADANDIILAIGGGET